MTTRRGHAAWLLPLLLPVTAFYVWLNWHDDLGSLLGDGLIYFLTARHYAPYWPADRLAAAYAAITPFPPAYPVLLAVTTAAATFRAAHVVTALTVVAAVAAMYAWLIALGLSRRQATAGALIVAAMPGTVVESLYLHPEALYVALSLSALALLAAAERAPRPGLLWAASVAIALAMLTRSVGITLLPALAVALVRSRPRAWPAMLVLPLLPMLAWSAVHVPPKTYFDMLASLAKMGPANHLRIVETSSFSAVVGMHDNLFQVLRLPWVAVALGIAAAAVAIWRCGRLHADGAYLLAYLVTLAIWPFPQEMKRLTWVVMPLLVGYLLWGGATLASRLSGRMPAAARGTAAAPATVLALVVIPVFALTLQRALHPLTHDEPALRHIPEWYGTPPDAAVVAAATHVLTPRALRAFAAHVPETACVFSMHLVVTEFYAERGPFFPPLEHVDDAAFEAQLRATGCRFFVLTLLPGHGRTTPYYPWARLQDRLTIVAQQKFVDPAGDEYVVAALAVLDDGRARD